MYFGLYIRYAAVSTAALAEIRVAQLALCKPPRLSRQGANKSVGKLSVRG